MSTERELLMRAMDFMDDVFENERQNLRAHALAADIDAHLKAPKRPLLRATFSGVPVRLEKVSDPKLGDYFVWVEEPKGETK